jgi:hypothetical protein
VAHLSVDKLQSWLDAYVPEKLLQKWVMSADLFQGNGKHFY